MSKWESLSLICVVLFIGATISYCYTHQTKYDCTRASGEVKLFSDGCYKHTSSNYNQCLDFAKEIYCEVK